MDSLAVGVFCFVIATIGAAGGLVFYNAFLPEIVTEDKYDAVSAKGFSFGYIGSVLLLIINLIMIQKYELFGFSDKGSATRIAFITVGLWWLGFAQITIRRLPSSDNEKPILSIVRKGIESVLNVWHSLTTQTNLKKFLFSFLFFNAGVQTVIYMATVFADKVLHFETAELIVLVLVIQLLGAAGAHFFAWLSKRYNNKKALIVTLTIWALVCVVASVVSDKTQFYMLGMLVGLVLGGAQSLSILVFMMS
jgi:MFS transporter, UMF1 family